MAEWTDELSLELLQLVQAERVLWDTRHPLYKEPEETFNSWRRIQSGMSVYLPASELEQRLDFLLQRYGKLEAKVKRSMKARQEFSPYDPGEPPEIFVPTWFAFEAIAKFLNPKRAKWSVRRLGHAPYLCLPVPSLTLMAEWTNDMSLELLELLKSERVLWDNRHPLYKEPEETFNAWRRIQAGMTVHLAASELERRKTVLFERYGKLEAKVKRSMKARQEFSPYEPGEPPEIFVPTWFAFEAIAKFLNPKRVKNNEMEMSGSSAPEKRVTFQEQFKLFSKFGDRESDGKHLKLSQSDKWMRQAKVIDGKKITSTDTGICFKKLKQAKLTETDYNTFLEDLAKSKGFDVSELKTKMVNCGPPGFTSTVSTSKAVGAVERLTDPAKYTGSHKERFDQTGKGKGLAGRRDDVDTSGYVSGYQNKNTYDKEHPTN